MSAPFVVETERLGLRLWTYDDVEASRAIFSDPRVWTYLAVMRARTLGPDEARARIDRAIATHAEHGVAHWALVERSTNGVVGSCGFRPPSAAGEASELEVGFTIAPWRWGRGYASEIVPACVAFGLSRVRRVIGLTHPDNAGARRVLESAGLSYEADVVEDDAPWARYAIARGP